MEEIARLRAMQFQIQRDELRKLHMTQIMQHEIDTPLLASNIYKIYSLLAQLAHIPTPEANCVQWNDEQMMRWIGKEFLPVITRSVLESRS